MSVINFILYGPSHVSFKDHPKCEDDLNPKITFVEKPYPYKQIEQYKKLIQMGVAEIASSDETGNSFKKYLNGIVQHIRIATCSTEGQDTWTVDCICQISFRNVDDFVKQYRYFRNSSLGSVTVLTGIAVANLIKPFLLVPYISSCALLVLSIFVGVRGYQAFRQETLLNFGLNARMRGEKECIEECLQKRHQFYQKRITSSQYTAPFETELLLLNQLHELLEPKQEKPQLKPSSIFTSMDEPTPINMIKQLPQQPVTEEAKKVYGYIDDSLKITWGQQLIAELIQEVGKLDCVFKQKFLIEQDKYKALSSRDLFLKRFEELRKDDNRSAALLPIKDYLDSCKEGIEKTMQPLADLQKESSQLFLNKLNKELKSLCIPLDEVPESSKLFILLKEVNITREEFLASYGFKVILSTPPKSEKKGEDNA